MNFPGDRTAKPPYSYAALICLAMATTEQKMTLNQIYIWIKEQFAYYRSGDQSWQVRERESKVKPSWNCSKLHQRKVNVFLVGFDNLELVKPWSCVLIMFYLLYKFSQSVSTVSGRQIDGLVSHRRLCPVLCQFLSFFCKNKNIPKKVFNEEVEKYLTLRCD